MLLVEDDDTLRGLVQRTLEARAYRVRPAGTVTEAVAAVRREAPAVLLLDINLPDGSGWDVLRTLRAQGQHIPTVVVSAAPVSRAHLNEYRAAAYLPKPFPLETLLAAMERLTRVPPAPVRADGRA